MTIAIEAGIVGRDPETLCTFYTRVLQFRIVDRFEHAVGTVYKFRRGDARLKIFFSVDVVDPVAEIEPWFRPGGWRYAALYLDAVEEVGARMALISDPEGNAWELLAEEEDHRS